MLTRLVPSQFNSLGRMPFAKQMRGITMVSMAIAIIIAGMLTLASARYALQKLKESKGNLIGNQLQTVADALEAYIEANKSTLILAASRTGSADKITVIASSLPTIDGLKTAGYLSSGMSSTPSYGGSYKFKIQVSPKAPSTTLPCITDCNIRGFVYLSDPITTMGSSTDIRLLGAAMEASDKKRVGYSLPMSPNLISLPGGSTEPNPDSNTPKRAGILLAATGVTGTSANANAMKHWLTPANFASLPTTNNTVGDVRMTLDTFKPHVWRVDSYGSPAAWTELFSSDVSKSVSIGHKSGGIFNPSGGTLRDNVMIGHKAGELTTHFANIMIGSSAGAANSIGSINTFIGYNSGKANTLGTNNVFVGAKTGESNTTGYMNTLIGSQAAVTSPTLQNATAIGYAAKVNANDKVVIGNASVNLIQAGVGITLWSDRRLKQDIRESQRGLEFIKQLKPVDYTLISNQLHETGLIAQDVQAVDPSFPGVKKPVDDKDFYGMTYTAFIPSIIKSIQQLDARLEQVAPSAAHTEIKLLKWLVLFLSVCVMACGVVIFRFNQSLRALRLTVQQIHPLSA